MKNHAISLADVQEVPRYELDFAEHFTRQICKAVGKRAQPVRIREEIFKSEKQMELEGTPVSKETVNHLLSRISNYMPERPRRQQR